MKNPSIIKLDWKAGEIFDGVTEVWRADGDMFALEVQMQDDDAVIGTAWRRISATFWEPEDVECILELEYESVGAAKFALEGYDSRVLQDEQELENLIEEGR
jgi:hypothetical protein